MINIIPFSIDHYHSIYIFWQLCNGIGLSDADSYENIHNYLLRNPGMSFIAFVNGMLAGTILAGHDGRRGYIHHLAVRENFRKQGIGKTLVDKSLKALLDEGIRKCHLFIFRDNNDGHLFWNHCGWMLRTDIEIMSKSIDPNC